MSDSVTGRRTAGASPRRRLQATMIAALSMSIIAAPIAAAQASQPNLTPQRIGQAPAVPQGSTPAPAPADDTVLNLNIELAPRDRAALDAFVASVSRPGSPQYHHYLAKGQFASTFGPTRQTIDAVTKSLSANGLKPGAVSADGLSIPVSATVAQLRQALNVGFTGYKVADGHTAYANTSAPQLPASVAPSVAAIVGLDNILKPTPHHTTPVKAATAQPEQSAPVVRPHTATPTVCSNIQQLLSNNGKYDTQNYWQPGSLSASYGYNTGQLYQQYGDNGNGITVALFELENYSEADLVAYERCFGAPVPVNAIKIDGGATGQPSAQTGVGVESALDIETIIGLAPGATINVYQGPDAERATYGNVLDVYRQMVIDDTAQVISTSWGSCEADLRVNNPGMIAAEGTIFAAAAAQGQTVVAASGDSGSTGCYPYSKTNNATLSTDDPAGQPYVTAVGGTRMQGTNGTETVWNTPATTANGNRGAASGGGVSAVSTLSGAGNYQSGVQGAGYANACNAPSGSTCRQVPDVSGLGDPATGYLVAFGQSPDGGQYWYIIGGTSGSAPLWAAIIALANSSHPCAANGPVGFINPALYQNAGAFRDITSGNNAVPSSGYLGGLYSATTGYDLATGLGSPNAPKIVEALCGAVPASPGSSFQPMSPTRVLDTRTNGSTIGQNSTLSLPLAGTNGIPSTGVTAVVLNVTATNPTGNSYLTVYPDGQARPVSSNLNFGSGQTIPNLVTVPVGANGKVDFYNHVGNVDVVADIFGYYTTNSGSLYQPVSPSRVLDTRTNGSTIGQNSTLSLPLAGTNGIPSTGVTAVVLNVTATNPTGNSYLTVYPDGQAQPVSSNLNFGPGQTIPNLVTVPVGANGKVDFYNHVGNVDVVADIFGYYTTSGTGFKFHASPPQRMADTRTGAGLQDSNGRPIGQDSTVGIPLENVGGLGNNGPLRNATALVLNVTATEPTADSFLTVYPGNLSRPSSSNLNFSAGQTIPNAVVTPVNGSFIDLWNHVGSVHAVVDIFGYFAAS